MSPCRFLAESRHAAASFRRRDIRARVAQKREPAAASSARQRSDVSRSVVMETEALTTSCGESPRAAGDHIPIISLLAVGGWVLEDARLWDRLLGLRVRGDARRGFGSSAGGRVQDGGSARREVVDDDRRRRRLLRGAVRSRSEARHALWEPPPKPLETTGERCVRGAPARRVAARTDLSNARS
jgi:hypothetical protein